MSALRPPRKWTAERVAMLKDEYATSTDDAALLARLNTLPGPAISSKSGMQMMAFEQGLKKTDAALAELQRRTGLASRGRKTSARRTPAREALIRDEYATAPDARQFFDRVNALPGPPLASPNALRQWVFALGLRKDPRTIAETKARIGLQNIARAHATTRVYAKKDRPQKPPRVVVERKPPAPVMRKARPARPEPASGRRMDGVDMTQARPTFVAAAPLPPEDLTPEQQADIADEAVARKHDLARKMLSRKVAPEKVQQQTRLPLREVYRLAMEVRS